MLERLTLGGGGLRGGVASGSDGMDAEENEELRAALEEMRAEVVELRMDGAERDVKLEEATKRAERAERAAKEAREELTRNSQAALDLGELVNQKFALQLENAGWKDQVEQLRREKEAILDAKEELHDLLEQKEEEIELLGRSAQDMAALQRESGKARGEASRGRRGSSDRGGGAGGGGGGAAAEFASPPLARTLSTRQSIAVGSGDSGVGSGGAVGTASGGSGGRVRQESKLRWPFGKSVPE